MADSGRDSTDCCYRVHQMDIRTRVVADAGAGCGIEKPLIKPHIITAHGSRKISCSSPDNEQGAAGRFGRLAHQLTSDERLVRERASGVRAGLYRLYGELGAGTSGATVRLGVHQLTKERVAVKVVDRAKLDPKKQEMLTQEVANMERLHHPNIIRLYEVVETSLHVHLVMEYAPSGDLDQRVQRDGPLTEADARSVMAQLISAVQHMHSKKLVHRDIKAENVFISGDPASGAPLRVQLGDLGFSQRVRCPGELLTQFCGSPSYACPELLNGASYRGEHADLWALGVLTYYMVTGKLPYDAETLPELRARILAGRYRWPAGVGSGPCRELVAALMRREADRRPSAAEAIRCRWLSGVPAPAPGRPLALRSPSAGGAAEKKTRARLRQLGVSDETLEHHRQRGVHSAVTGLYRLELHRICREEADGDGKPTKELWLPALAGDKCTIL